MKKNISNEKQYVFARKRVEKIAKFYKHLAIYIAVNIFLSAIFIVGDMNDGETFEEAFFNLGNFKIWIYWGLGVLFQAINIFGLPFFLNKDWEQRKLQQYLEEENKRR